MITKRDAISSFEAICKMQIASMSAVSWVSGYAAI